MNVVFLSPHFPPHFERFCVRLAHRGARVLGIGDAPLSSLSGQLQASLSDYIYVRDMLDSNAMQRALGLLTYRHGKIDRLDSLNEHWLGVEASLRRDFNIFGLQPEDLERGRGKAGMRRVFEASGIPCAAGVKAENFAELEDFANTAGYPLVVKPDLGVGAVGALRLDGPADLVELGEKAWPGTLIAEEYLDGILMSYDGLVDRHGRVVFEHCTEVNRGVMEIMRDRGAIHYFSLRRPPQALMNLGRRIVEAFELQERFFHIEAFRLPGDDFRALEINLRPPGGFSTDMMNYSYDIDVYELWARVILGEDLSDWSYERRYYCAHIGRRDHIEYLHSSAALADILHDQVMMHQTMPPVFAAAMGDELFMIRNPDRAALARAIAMIEETA